MDTIGRFLRILEDEKNLRMKELLLRFHERQLAINEKLRRIKEYKSAKDDE